MAVQILTAIAEGFSWKAVSPRAFNGQGSCGNGGAMRSAPIGAYFADDYDRVIYEAKLSAEVTHSHPDGKTGAVAIALAAAWMAQPEKRAVTPGYALVEFVLEQLPQTETYFHLMKALNVPLGSTAKQAAAILGNGSRVVSSDTVPFCLWCAARHPNDFQSAMWTTVSGFGDRDTTCAIVGRESIPLEWLEAREAVQI
jgi:ADP-ribosylglycohydrolase